MSQPVSRSASGLGGGVVVQKQKAGVYTVLLVLAFLAIVVGCLLLYAVVQRYDGELAPTGISQSMQHRQQNLAAVDATPVTMTSRTLS